MGQASGCFFFWGCFVGALFVLFLCQLRLLLVFVAIPGHVSHSLCMSLARIKGRFASNCGAVEFFVSFWINLGSFSLTHSAQLQLTSVSRACPNETDRTEAGNWLTGNQGWQKGYVAHFYFRLAGESASQNKPLRRQTGICLSCSSTNGKPPLFH